MREEIRDWILLIGKSAVFVIGGILFVAALVELSVAGWSWLAAGILLLGLALAVPPLAFAFRDAYREAKKGKLGGESE